MVFADGSRYVGQFEKGLFSGLGVMIFNDNSRYDGEFKNGKYDGLGVFVRSDDMMYEGEFKDGKISGRGLITFPDGNHGLPRNEGRFENDRFIERLRCPDVIQRAKKAAVHANSQAQEVLTP